jgi:hypothetical protein
MDAASKTRILALIRWAVTLGAITWVLLRIDWRDQVCPPVGEPLRGRVEVRSDRYLVTTADGATHEVLRDANGESFFLPGFLTLLKNMQPIYLLIGLLVLPFSNVLGAFRWRELMRAHAMDIAVYRSLQLTWLGFFWSLVFPGITGGDVVKAYAVTQTAQKRAVAVLIVLLDRIIGLVGLAILSGIVILFNLHNAELRTVSTGILAFLAIMVGGGLLFFSRRLRRWSGFDVLLGLLPFQERVTQLDEALFHYRYHKRAIAVSLLLSLGTHAVNVGTFCFAGRALGLPVAWQHYFVFIPVMLMIAALPISVGGLGVFESGVAHFLTLRGVGATSSGAFALCVLYRIMTIIVGVPGALVRVRGQSRGGEDATAQQLALGALVDENSPEKIAAPASEPRSA